jgi:hypothetical protein
VIVVGILAPGPAGERAVAIARRAAASGARIEVVGVVAATPAGDAMLLELAAVDIGHATIIRSAAQGIEPADLDLALRYLPDVRAVVLVDPDASLLPVARAAAAWSGASLVVVAAAGEITDEAPGPEAIVLQPPASDPDGTFAGFVAALAARLDAGEEPTVAWRSTIDALAVDPVSGSA